MDHRFTTFKIHFRLHPCQIIFKNQQMYFDSEQKVLKKENIFYISAPLLPESDWLRNESVVF